MSRFGARFKSRPVESGSCSRCKRTVAEVNLRTRSEGRPWCIDRTEEVAAAGGLAHGWEYGMPLPAEIELRGHSVITSDRHAPNCTECARIGLGPE
jgi:hypothetical protein